MAQKPTSLFIGTFLCAGCDCKVRVFGIKPECPMCPECRERETCEGEWWEQRYSSDSKANK